MRGAQCPAASTPPGRGDLGSASSGLLATRSACRALVSRIVPATTCPSVRKQEGWSARVTRPAMGRSAHLAGRGHHLLGREGPYLMRLIHVRAGSRVRKHGSSSRPPPQGAYPAGAAAAQMETPGNRMETNALQSLPATARGAAPAVGRAGCARWLSVEFLQRRRGGAEAPPRATGRATSSGRRPRATAQ